MSRSVIATYVIPFWFNTEKSYLLFVILRRSPVLIVMEVVLGLRRELGKQTLRNLSKVSGRFLIGRAERLLAENHISVCYEIRNHSYRRLIVA